MLVRLSVTAGCSTETALSCVAVQQRINKKNIFELGLTVDWELLKIPVYYIWEADVNMS